MRSFGGGSRWRWVVAAAAVVAVAVAALGLWYRDDKGGVGAGPETTVAQDDDEWLALIDAARQAKSEPGATWPEGRVQEGVAIARSCTEIPANAQLSDSAIEYSPDGSRRRLVVNYFVLPDSRYQLILYDDSDFSGCTSGMRDAVVGRDVRREAVDAHICDEMKRMAEGLPRTDMTLRPASPAVAKAYLEAFCTAVPATPSPAP